MTSFWKLSHNSFFVIMTSQPLKGSLTTVNKRTLAEVQQIDDVEHSSRATMNHPLNFKKTQNIKDAPFPTLLDRLSTFLYENFFLQKKIFLYSS